MATMCMPWVLVSLSAAVLVVPGCGKWPAVAENATDVNEIPDSARGIRVRGLSDEDVLSLGRLKQLVTITFFGGWGSTDAKLTDRGVKNLASLDLPALFTLHLGPNDRITDEALTYLLDMKQLGLLGLAGCRGITDRGLEVIAQMSWLSELDVRGNPNITDSGVIHLGGMKNLKRLILDGCPKVTEVGVTRIRGALSECKVMKNDELWRKQMRR